MTTRSPSSTQTGEASRSCSTGWRGRAPRTSSEASSRPLSAVDEDATELQLLLPHVVLPISELWIRERPDTSYGSDWARRRDELNRLGLRIERNARRPMRNAAKIRAAAADTVARVWAMTHDWNASQALVTASQHADLVNRQPSRVAIKRARLDDLMQSYRVQFREERAADS